jgi:hypothetical protein
VSTPAERIATWRRIRDRLLDGCETLPPPSQAIVVSCLGAVADELGIEARGHVVELVPERDAPKRVET